MHEIADMFFIEKGCPRCFSWKKELWIYRDCLKKKRKAIGHFKEKRIYRNTPIAKRTYKAIGHFKKRMIYRAIGYFKEKKIYRHIPISERLFKTIGHFKENSKVL